MNEIAPGPDRTGNPRFRRPILYPVELQAQNECILYWQTQGKLTFFRNKNHPHRVGGSKRLYNTPHRVGGSKRLYNTPHRVGGSKRLYNTPHRVGGSKRLLRGVLTRAWHRWLKETPTRCISLGAWHRSPTR